MLFYLSRLEIFLISKFIRRQCYFIEAVLKFFLLATLIDVGHWDALKSFLILLCCVRKFLLVNRMHYGCSPVGFGIVNTCRIFTLG